MKFEHSFDQTAEDTYYFALTYPFSYSECQQLIDTYEKTYTNHPSIYFCRELLSQSLEGRRIDLLTITDRSGLLPEQEALIPGLFPGAVERAQRFSKPTVFVSARVHPGETQGSHMMNGLLSFLLNE